MIRGGMLGWLRAMGQVLWGMSVVTQPGSLCRHSPRASRPSPLRIYRNASAGSVSARGGIPHQLVLCGLCSNC